MTDSRARFLALGAIALVASTATADDWPAWGRTAARNNSCNETGLPSNFKAGKFLGASDEIDPKTTENVKWIAKLGSQSYGNPTVADGRVYVGTNNDVPRDERFTGDRSCVYCFDEATGDFLWELNVPKLGTGKVSDWEYLGICSSPTIDGDKMYILTNRCEVTCIDINGMKDGNQGFQGEGAYMGWAPGGKSKTIEVKQTDADILWSFNMIDECGVFPHNITSSSIAIVGDRLWVSTSNGVDYGHVETPAPFAPCLIVVDKNTGELVAEEQSGLSQDIFHANWTSPAYLKEGELEMAIFGGPSGWMHAFSPTPTTDEDGYPVLEELWRIDANPAHYREQDGKKLKYATRGGPSEVLGTPMVDGKFVYAVIGQDPEHGEGVGNMVCIDAQKGEIVWSYDEINRSLSSMALVDGLLYTADYSGFVYCMEAKTGKLVWRHDTMGHIWGSPLVADGKVYIGNEDGYLTIIPAGREYAKDSVVEVDMTSPVYSSPIAANGVLYVATHTHLFAIAESAGSDESEEKK
ncbi:MAG: PQQ-binding-like beta-propeller repeat protein [Planctomycetota bacterium]|nr:PQQ-binding-like beta-propeller repeat protein [Planctomycetota bacterium]